MTDEFLDSLIKELSKTFVTKEEFATPKKFSVSGDVSAEVTFDGSRDVFVNVRVKNSESATSDEYGNNIVETYARISDLPNMEFQIEEYEGSPCLFIMLGEKFYRFVGEEVIFDETADA